MDFRLSLTWRHQATQKRGPGEGLHLVSRERHPRVDNKYCGPPASGPSAHISDEVLDEGIRKSLGSTF